MIDRIIDAWSVLTGRVCLRTIYHHAWWAGYEQRVDDERSDP